MPLPAQELTAVRVDVPPSVDGELSDEVWNLARPATSFTQLQPRPGEPASERSEISVIYTSTALYIGAFLADSKPKLLVAKEMERDSNVSNDDSVSILLDTFDDDRNGYVFSTNPNGARRDALVTEEGRDVNVQWDGVWKVATRITERGWIAEFELPLSTLSFDPEVKSWGFNVHRTIRRRNEEVYWVPLPLEAANSYSSPLHRVSLAGSLNGIGGLGASRRLFIKPYLLTSAMEDPLADTTDSDTEGGIDLQWSPTRSLTLDITANTDFAEVEVDNQQINLTRFSLFFPEKREFFLENAGIFNFGTKARAPWDPTLFSAFFSRRIGLEDGNTVPIDFGTRLTGRAGAWDLGFLGVRTGGLSSENLSSTDFGVARVKRNLGERSSVGVVATHRDSADSGASRLFGIDAEVKPSQRWGLSGFLARTKTPPGDTRTTGEAYGAGARYQGPELAASLDHYRIERGFSPDAGFLLRKDFRMTSPRLTWQPRIETNWLRNWWSEIVFTRFDRDSTGELESENFSISPIGFDTQSGEFFWAGWQRDREQVFEPFEISDGVVIPEALYESESGVVGFSSNRSRAVTFNNITVAGDFFDGDILSSDTTIGLRLSKHLRMRSSWSANEIDLPQADYSANLFTQRVDISWTADMRLNLLAQWNEAGELAGVNARFHWIWRPGADLFVVYNQNWSAPTLSRLETIGRQLVVKVNYRFEPKWRRSKEKAPRAGRIAYEPGFGRKEQSLLSRPRRYP